MKTKKPKFRRITLHISNDAFTNLEEYAKFAKISKSKVMTELIENVDCPLALIYIIASNIEQRITRKAQGELDTLDFRRGRFEEKHL